MYIYVMTSDGNSELTGVMLKDVVPIFLDDMKIAAQELGNQDMKNQLDRVFVACQALNGNAENFSFMGYPIPRLTFEERSFLELNEYEMVALKVRGGVVSLDLDDFGKINWFYVKGLPELYNELLRVDECIGCNLNEKS